MNEMKNFINITIATSITTIIVLMLKALLKNKISPKWQFALWIIIALRLIIPAFPESKVSVYNALPNAKVVKIMVVSKHVVDNVANKTKTYISSNVATNKSNQNNFSDILINNVSNIWLVGAIIMFLYIVSIYFVYNRKTKKLKLVEDTQMLSVLDECKKELYINTLIKLRIGTGTPLLKGIFSPEIIFPKGYTNQELKSVFIHELMHYKHKDIILNMLSLLLLCVYWYNPIIWFCYFVFRRDMEILCDYRVLQVYDNRKEYASVLLKTALNKNKFLVCTTSMKNNEKDISKRIKYIAYFKKPKIVFSAIATILTIIVIAICLTNPMSNTSNIINTSNTKLNYQEIYKHKTLYVGAAYKVGNLTSWLFYAKYKHGFALQTSAKPYVVNVHYEVKKGDICGIQNDAIKITDNMLRNASIMFCLIDNVDKIKFDFNDGDRLYNFSFERQYFNNIFGKDIREFSKSENKFKNEFMPMMMKKDWENVKLYYNNHNNYSIYTIESEVEKNLKIIMSSPKESSNSNDYMKTHENECQAIIDMGNGALNYMLLLFANGQDKGLKANIMMPLCIEILGDKNNVKAGSYNSPKEWYSKFSLDKNNK